MVSASARWLVGMMSEWLFNGTSNSLGYALAALHIVGLWGGLHFIAAGKRLAARRIQFVSAACIIDSRSQRWPASCSLLMCHIM